MWFRLSITLFCATLCALLAQTSRAATYIVDQGGGGHALTITLGADMAADGDTLLIFPGVYGEAVSTTKGLHFIADGPGVIWDADVATPCLLITTASEAGVHGIEFVGGSGLDANGILLDTVGGIVAIHNCTFTNMTSSWAGGALYSRATVLDLSGCAFTNCHGTGTTDLNGGGAYIWSASSGSMITGCTFSGCSTQGMGGGLFAIGDHDITIQNCVFEGCTAAYGGALGIIGDPAEVIDCNFIGNYATESGGAIFVSSYRLIMEGSTLRDNVAETVGGGVCMANGTSSCVIHHDLFHGNSAVEGGGIFTAAVNFTSSYNTFFANEGASIGAAIYVYSGAADLQSDIYCRHSGAAALYDLGSPTIGCCAFWDNFGGNAGGFSNPVGSNDCFESDPQFCDWISENFDLASTSPCVPAHSPGACGSEPIGAFGEGCSQTPTHKVTWGQIFTLFHER